VTQYINFQLLEATTDQLDVLDMAGWEAGLFAVCTFANVAAFLFWVVYIFEIIQMEVDALRAQQEVSCLMHCHLSKVVRCSGWCTSSRSYRWRWMRCAHSRR
jgi:hypothetical protein